MSRLTITGKTFFTSDTHFGHTNIIRYCNRPFKTADEMNSALVKSWNKTVSSEDTVFHLGDFSFTNNPHFFNSLNGKIHLILGNHDHLDELRPYNWESVSSYTEVNYKGQLIVLCHYPMRSWNKSSKGSYMLYGHEHDNLEHTPYGKSMDVGVDSAYRILKEFRPFSFEEVNNILSKR